MREKQFYIFIGNYGSGKTELSINFALKEVEKGLKTMLIDLDIVNPYFRSTEQAEYLENSSVELISAPYGTTNIDLPVVSPRIARAFAANELERVIFDVGGDPVGATALGRYNPDFIRMGPENVHVYFVVNVRRPLTQTLEDLETLYSQIRSSARLPIEGFINNSNLSRESSVSDLIDGQALLAELCDKTGLPVLYTTGLKANIEEFKKTADLSKNVGELLEINTVMRPEWLDFAE